MSSPSLTDAAPTHAPSGRPARRRARRLAAALAVGLVLAVAHRPLLTGYARLFRVDDPAPSDALVFLSDTPEAVAVYRGGLAPLVLTVSGAPFPFPDLNLSEVRRQCLIRRGVPADAIRVLATDIPFPDDRQEARRVAAYARSHAPRRITVVASAAQTARLRRTYRRALRGTGVEVRMAAVPDPWYDEATWYTTDEGLVAYFDETIHWLVSLVSP